MRRQRFYKGIVIFFFVTACSREEPAPPPVSATTSTPPLVARPTAQKMGGSYDEAVIWLKSAPRFRFVVEEDGVRAEGTMTRETVGAEKIELRANGDEWRAEAGPRGVTWQKRMGGAWSEATAPDHGNRLYQRVTLAFDPSKKEGSAQLVSSEDGSSHYRFTDANTGNVHEVWVSQADNHIERIRIGERFAMTIEPQK